MGEWVDRLRGGVDFNGELSAEALRQTFQEFEVKVLAAFPHIEQREPHYRIVALLLSLARAPSSSTATTPSSPSALRDSHGASFLADSKETGAARDAESGGSLSLQSDDEKDSDDGWDGEYSRSTSPDEDEEGDEEEVDDTPLPSSATTEVSSVRAETLTTAERWARLHDRPPSPPTDSTSSFLRALDVVWREVDILDGGGLDWMKEEEWIEPPERTPSPVLTPTLQRQLQAEAEKSHLHPSPCTTATRLPLCRSSLSSSLCVGIGWSTAHRSLC